MKYYANIRNSVYQVRVENGEAEILYKGTWLNNSNFIDVLIKDGKRDEVTELALYGLRTCPEKCLEGIL